MKKVYGFEIKDNDHSTDYEFMLYILKDNMLKPIIEKFERGFDNLFTFDQMISCLKFNNIQKLITYQPNLCETVCCHPYELNTKEEFKLCEFDGKWNRFSHLEIFLSKKENKILEANNTQLIRLNKEEVNKLESKLKFHY